MAPAEASASSSSTTKNGGSNKKEEQNAFAQHAAADSALHAPPPSSSSNGQQQQQQQQQQPESGGLTFGGRLAVFLLFPAAAGALGLYLAWLETPRRHQPEQRQLSLDRDFCVPFLLALALAGVVGVQTGGFRARRVEPLIAWPKVKRVRKVVVVRKKKQEKPIKEE